MWILNASLLMIVYIIFYSKWSHYPVKWSHYYWLSSSTQKSIRIRMNDRRVKNAHQRHFLHSLQNSWEWLPFPHPQNWWKWTRQLKKIITHWRDSKNGTKLQAPCLILGLSGKKNYFSNVFSRRHWSVTRCVVMESVAWNSLVQALQQDFTKENFWALRKLECFTGYLTSHSDWLQTPSIISAKSWA